MRVYAYGSYQGCVAAKRATDVGRAMMLPALQLGLDG